MQNMHAGCNAYTANLTCSDIGVASHSPQYGVELCCDTIQSSVLEPLDFGHLPLFGQIINASLCQESTLVSGPMCNLVMW